MILFNFVTIFVRRSTVNLCLFFLMLFLCLGNNVFAESSSRDIKTTLQVSEIRGVVVGSDSQPLVGVTVSVKGQRKGTVTDEEGRFVLTDVADNAVLIFSIVGYEKQEVSLNGRSELNVILSPVITSLDQVVVVGYGTEKARNLTGAIATINMEDKLGQPVTNTNNLFYGVPGVFANLSTSQPGVDRAMIRIRGVGTLSGNDPLVLVDGIEFPMNEIDPNDIASISILKDASAAIYGSKAANGVILITTKKGGGKGRVDYNFYYGRQKPTNLIDLVWDPIAYMKALNQAEKNEGKNLQTFSEEEIGEYQLGMLFDPYTYPANNWYKIAERDGGGIIRKHNISASGGNKEVKYRLSLGYLDRDGIYIGNGNKEKKYSFGFNTTAKVSKRLEVGASLNGNYRKYTMPVDDVGTFMSQLMRSLPIQNDTLEDGNNGYTFLRIPGHNNWTTSRQYMYDGYNKKSIMRFLGMITATYNLPFDINYKVNLGLDKYDGITERFVPRQFQLQAKTRDTLQNRSIATAPRSYSTDANTKNVHFFNTLDWSHEFGSRHFVSIMVGSSYDNYLTKNASAQVQGFDDDLLTDLNVGTRFEGISGNTTQEGLASYFGRLNYRFQGKYLVEGIFRYDGSSRFARGHRWGFFPGVSAGWMIDQEDFMRNLDFIDQLKLRGSIGQTGNQVVPLYSYENTVTLGHDYSFGGPNGVLVSGAAATTAADPTTSWETTTDYNLGIDGSFFKNKISFTLDLYNKITKDIIRTVNLPSQVGNLGGPRANVGKVRNMGYEFSLIFQEQNLNGWGYRVYGNVSYNKNEVIDLEGEELLNFGTNLPTMTKAGYPIDAFYLLDVEGIFQSEQEVANSAFQNTDTRPGYLKYKDVNEDGEINGDDRIILNISSIMPKYTFGFGFSLNFNGINLSTEFQGIAKMKSLPITRPATPLNNGANLSWEWLTDSWTPDNPDAKLPILTEANYSDNFRQSTALLRSIDYLRLKNIQLSYSLPSSLISKARIQKLDVFINGQNLFTISPFNKMGDPESMYNAEGLSHYPMLKTINAGINVTF